MRGVKRSSYHDWILNRLHSLGINRRLWQVIIFMCTGLLFAQFQRAWKRFTTFLLYLLCIKATHKKIFYGQADRKRWHPPLYGQLFVNFFWCSFDFILWLCVLKRFLHKKKSISMQLLESPPLTAAALWMIICKRPAPHFDKHEKGMKSAFLRPFTMR